MIEEFLDMPLETTHNLLLPSKISDFAVKETKEGSSVRSVISSLLKDKNTFSNIQVTVDNTKLAEMRHAFRKDKQLAGCDYYFDFSSTSSFNPIQNQMNKNPSSSAYFLQQSNSNNSNNNPLIPSIIPTTETQQQQQPQSKIPSFQLSSSSSSPPPSSAQTPSPSLRLVNKIGHFEIFTDLPASCYSSQKETQTEQRMPSIVKKIAKRVKVDYLRDRLYLHNSRVKLHIWLFEQIKPAIRDAKLGNGSSGGSKQKLKRDLMSISNYDKKGKQVQAEMNETKVEYSHIFNVQSIIDMQQSFFPSRKSHPIRLYYPLKENVCLENAILAPPPTNTVRFIRMLPKRIDCGFDKDLHLSKTFIIKIKHLINFFQIVTLKGSDYPTLAQQTGMDYFQVKVLYDSVSKVFQLSKFHKEQRKKSLQKKDKVQLKMQEIKDHLRIIFADIYDQQGDDLLFNPEEVFVSYGDLQRRINEYFHPAESVSSSSAVVPSAAAAFNADEEKIEEPPLQKVESERRKNDDYNNDDELTTKTKKRKTYKHSSFLF